MRILVAFAIMSLACLGSARADDKKPDAYKPAYRVLAVDKGHAVIINAKGEVEWEVECKHDAHDIAMLPNGNVLLHTGPTTVVEMTPEKKIVWKHESKPLVVPPSGGIGQPMPPEGGTTSGNARIIEVDQDDKIVREIPLTVKNPDPHRDTRLVRKLENGNYLVCHEGDGMVREYDDKGKVVWSYTLDLAGRPRSPGHGPEGHGAEVFGAIRKSNGNTIIAGGNNNRVLEVDPKGKMVWSIGHDELPGIRLAWVTTLKLLPNGNLIVGNCHAGPDNPQLIEVTPEKNVVWTFNDFKNLGNSTAAAVVLDVKADASKPE